jgi:hypothetical protein
VYKEYTDNSGTKFSYIHVLMFGRKMRVNVHCSTLQASLSNFLHQLNLKLCYYIEDIILVIQSLNCCMGKPFSFNQNAFQTDSYLFTDVLTCVFCQNILL